MADYLAPWRQLSDRNGAIRFIDANLRGAGQVMLQDNPLTGLLFIVGVAWGASVAGRPQVAISGIVALVAATLTAMALNADATSLRQGTFGFNGILVGIAVPTFLVPTPAMWLVLLIGAAVSTIAMQAISHVTKLWGIPALTFPFVLTTWLLLLSAYSFARLPIASMGPPAFPTAAAAAPMDFSASSLLDAVIRGVSQVFLIDNTVAGTVFIIALLVSSVWAAVFAVAGATVAVVLAMVLGASQAAVAAGLYGFSPVLTAIALGAVFFKPSWRVALFALLGTAFAAIVQGALDAALAPIGIPTFTAAFVLVTWLFLLPRDNLQPHPHAPIKNGVVTDK
jgi:urea transporter